MLLGAVVTLALGVLAGSGPGLAEDPRPASLEAVEQAKAPVTGADSGVVDEARRAGDGPGGPQSTDEDSDLGRIPELPGGNDRATTDEPAPSQETSGAGTRAKARADGGVRTKNSLQSATQATALRSPAFPAPPPGPPAWAQHFLLDSQGELGLASPLQLVWAVHGDLHAEQDLPFPSHENVRLDIRELHLDWEVLPSVFLTAGRVNLRRGVALGFNPTDFFRTKAVVEPLSADPAVLRDTRLGTVALRLQSLWEGGGASIAYAPRLSTSRPLYSRLTLPSLDPMLDRTNDLNRVVAAISQEWTNGISTELVGAYDGQHPLVGANLSYGLGTSLVAYLEWSGGPQPGLVHAALDYGRRTGTLPPQATSPIPDDDRVGFQNDLAAGFSYTAFGRLTLNLEYHFHQAGLSRGEWKTWFDAGLGGSGSLQAVLWYIRGYAAEQQEPASQHYAFLRANWPDFGVRDLELTGLVLVNLQDGSAFVQVNADYYLSSRWTVGALVAGNMGPRRSEFGSLPGAVSALLKVSWYF
jgi:hypothetical protein